MSLQNLQTIKDNFVKELQDAQAGTKNSLAFIVNQIPKEPLVKDGEIFQVMTIGGSVCRKALIKKEGDKLTILEQDDSATGVFKTKEDLINCIVSLLDPNIDIVALNFAYPLDPIFEDSKLDAIFINGTKEHTFEGLAGQQVGKEIEKHVSENLNRKIKVSVANDTICLLLSGLTKYPAEKLAAGIVGTGFNFAFFLDNERLINLEAGNFNKFTQTATGKIVDESSAQPGVYIFEKEVAGGYLYKHFNVLLKEKNLDYPELDSSKGIDEAINSGRPEIVEIAKLVIENAASLVACIVAGIMEFQEKDLVFVMEGSMFWKGIGYKETVEEKLKELTSYKAEFVHIDDSTVMGGAKLVA